MAPRIPSSPMPTDEDAALDASLRPGSMDEFVGQERIKENLSIYVEAARMRGEALDHVLLSGPPGLGKTTLAGIVANELGVKFYQTSGPALERARDLVGVLSRLKEREVFFIDEIHRMQAAVEEYLHSAMEDYHIDVLVDQGRSAQSIRLPLKRFTLLGATTREGLLSGPFRARFGIPIRLDYYPPHELDLIVKRSARILQIQIDSDASMEIARRARGTPRMANRYLRRVRDLATVRRKPRAGFDVAREALDRMGIDHIGLDEMDRRIISCLLAHDGGPVGLKTIAVTVGEEEDTIEDVYEPFLVRVGFLKKTPRGRVASAKAFEHMGKSLPGGGQGVLFK